MPVKKTPTKGSGPGDGSFKTPTREAKTPRTPGSKSSVPGSGSESTSKKKRRFDDKEWNFTHSLPSSQDIKSNGRVEGRNLITWTRKLAHFPHFTSGPSSFFELRMARVFIRCFTMALAEALPPEPYPILDLPSYLS